MMMHDVADAVAMMWRRIRGNTEGDKKGGTRGGDSDSGHPVSSETEIRSMQAGITL
jgi:hypothetical protein